MTHLSTSWIHRRHNDVNEMLMNNKVEGPFPKVIDLFTPTSIRMCSLHLCTEAHVFIEMPSGICP